MLGRGAATVANSALRVIRSMDTLAHLRLEKTAGGGADETLVTVKTCLLAIGLQGISSKN